MKSKPKFFCFSPPVMLATFLIEFGLLAYTICRYKMTKVARLAATILFCLGLFQLAEFISCGSTDYLLWSKIGFVSITMLPPLCVHLIQAITKRSNKRLLLVSYGAAAVFTLVFLGFPGAFIEYVCGGNYVLFQLNHDLAAAYTVYYYGLLLLGIVLCYGGLRTRSKNIKRALKGQLFGYLSFLVPTAIIASLYSLRSASVPSVMCGFAVIYALTIVFIILPASTQRKI